MTLKTYITRTHVKMDVAVRANTASGAENKVSKQLSNEILKQLIRDKKVEWIDNYGLIIDSNQTKFTEANHFEPSGKAVEIHVDD